MSFTSSYKKKHSFEKRKHESQRIKKKYPDRVPVIVEKLAPRKSFWRSLFSSSEYQQKVDENKKKHQCKYLIPRDFTMGQFSYVFRKKANLKSEEGIYFFISKDLTMCSNSSLIKQIYKEHGDPDGFLYIGWKLEDTFG